MDHSSEIYVFYDSHFFWRTKKICRIILHAFKNGPSYELFKWVENQMMTTLEETDFELIKLSLIKQTEDCLRIIKVRCCSLLKKTIKWLVVTELKAWKKGDLKWSLKEQVERKVPVKLVAELRYQRIEAWMLGWEWFS